MKVAIVSDVHGNLVALEAVLADLELLRPDLVVHGGDLAFNGPHPVECVDRIRELGWPGVIGNMDVALERSRHQPRVAWAARRLGSERTAWLQELPMEWRDENRLALVHATPEDVWRAVPPDADDRELRAIFGPLCADIAVYCHIHRPFIRTIGDLTVANTGSVGLPFDGIPRASYLLVDGGRLELQRVTYDVERAVAEVLACGMPDADLVADLYRTAKLPD